MPGFEPFLLCDLHVRTRWSGGRLSVREMVDLYGRTRRFDAIAITDQIVPKMTRGHEGAGELDGRLSRDTYTAYLSEIDAEAARAMVDYQMLVIPGAEIQPATRWGRRPSLVALGLRTWIDPERQADIVLDEIHRHGAVCIADTRQASVANRIDAGTSFLWSHRSRVRSVGDLMEAMRLDGAWTRVSPARTVAGPSETGGAAEHVAGWKTLVRSAKNWTALAGTLSANVDLAVTLYRPTSGGALPREASVGGR